MCRFLTIEKKIERRQLKPPLFTGIIGLNLCLTSTGFELKSIGFTCGDLRLRILAWVDPRNTSHFYEKGQMSSFARVIYDLLTTLKKLRNIKQIFES